ncbi:MAG: sigma-54-dependent Fis family transcriptional regulator [bacterium]|nr:sigma-54-dependent Fis family transcriptional regulator [bacterium]
MIEVIKNKIWNLLKEKEVSLVMIYDINGNILWHKGRPIASKNVRKGVGFSKSYIQKAFENDEVLDTRGLVVSGVEGNATPSTLSLHIKSLIIKRINRDYFLYIDSGTKESFNPTECETFRVMGEILGDTIQRIKKNETAAGGITGGSDATAKIREQVITYSMSDEPVLLTGETGTGKSHIAQLIHHYSGREGNFKLIHTPGIPENLFESEMFGYKKGAFTDASFDKRGLVEEADGGTLFIDEITEVSVALQAKLLRFIETGKFTRLGESFEKEVDVRVVAATNRDLNQAIESKSFREDLYYRLNVFEVQLPPLRDRKEDLAGLLQEKKSYLNGKKIGSGFWDAIYQHHWPGNVRELFSLLKRAGVQPGAEITGQDIREIIGMNGKHSISKPDPDAIDGMWQRIISGNSFWEVVKKPFLARDLKRSEVKALISRGLAETGGKYKVLLEMFNLKDSDYHRFMRFLHEQDLRPSSRLTARTN